MEAEQKMPASSVRSKIFIDQSTPLSSCSSVRSGINLGFVMSLLTELEELKVPLAIDISLPAELVTCRAC
jgi:hypothetical protein